MGVLRDFKEGELTLKDMSVMRENRSAKDQHKRTNGELIDYTLQHRIVLGWNEDTNRDLIPFTITVDNDSYTLSWAELRDLDREGFFRRESNRIVYALRYLDGKRVVIDVNLNDEAQRDMMVRFHFDKKEVIIDWYQFLMIGRFI